MGARTAQWSQVVYLPQLEPATGTVAAGMDVKVYGAHCAAQRQPLHQHELLVAGQGRVRQRAVHTNVGCRAQADIDAGGEFASSWQRHVHAKVPRVPLYQHKRYSCRFRPPGQLHATATTRALLRTQNCQAIVSNGRCLQERPRGVVHGNDRDRSRGRQIVDCSSSQSVRQ